ncbi:MAG: PASTA domain-containing protein [Flavisolibacter sp.]|jgi:beta-lactam-binding protein with PASTA domain
MIKYITRRPLWFNILVAIALILLIFVIFMLSLNWITKHGEAKTVPSVTGKNINDVEKFLSDAGFETVVQDSVYYDSLPPGIVVKQVPEPDQVVKVNRTVYVVINRFVAPDVSLPNLIGFSFRNAEMTLNSQGLRLGDTTYRADFAKNSVLEMSYNGNPVKPGDKVKVGSVIDLVLAGGLGEEDMPVPKLLGLTLAEARILLDQNGLVLGSPIPVDNVRDLESAFIVRQNPMTRTPDGVQIRIRPGQMIDVWLSISPPVQDTSSHIPPPQIPQ